MAVKSHALAAALALAASGPALAADPSVPRVGSETGVVVPHALPGPDATGPHTGQHLTAPSGGEIRAAEGGPAAADSPTGRAGTAEESRHSDIVARPGPVSPTGQDRGVDTPTGR